MCENTLQQHLLVKNYKSTGLVLGKPQWISMMSKRQLLASLSVEVLYSSNNLCVPSVYGSQLETPWRVDHPFEAYNCLRRFWKKMSTPNTKFFVGGESYTMYGHAVRRAVPGWRGPTHWIPFRSTTGSVEEVATEEQMSLVSQWLEERLRNIVYTLLNFANSFFRVNVLVDDRLIATMFSSSFEGDLNFNLSPIR